MQRRACRRGGDGQAPITRPSFYAAASVALTIIDEARQDQPSAASDSRRAVPLLADKHEGGTLPFEAELSAECRGKRVDESGVARLWHGERRAFWCEGKERPAALELGGIVELHDE